MVVETAISFSLGSFKAPLRVSLKFRTARLCLGGAGDSVVVSVGSSGVVVSVGISLVVVSVGASDVVVSGGVSLEVVSSVGGPALVVISGPQHG